MLISIPRLVATLLMAARPAAAAYGPEICDDKLDNDGDGWCHPFDVCALVADPTQADADGDGAGDACPS